MVLGFNSFSWLRHQYIYWTSHIFQLLNSRNNLIPHLSVNMDKGKIKCLTFFGHVNGTYNSPMSWNVSIQMKGLVDNEPVSQGKVYTFRRELSIIAVKD